MSESVPIRDAASLIVVRDAATTPRVLMGQRGKTAAFMPNKYVFPGGAVDRTDAEVLPSPRLDPICATRLTQMSDEDLSVALAASAIRELWEETGLVLGTPGQMKHIPPGWEDFAASGHVPAADGLRFVFRAITPPGRPRRFDARFFLVNATAIVSDLDDFSRACDELSHLHWVSLDEARSLDLPFITEVVLAEVAGLLGQSEPPASVPFFKNDSAQSQFIRLV